MFLPKRSTISSTATATVPVPVVVAVVVWAEMTWTCQRVMSATFETPEQERLVAMLQGFRALRVLSSTNRVRSIVRFVDCLSRVETGVRK